METVPVEKTVSSPTANGPPIHPGLVHFPIALNILSWLLDIAFATAPFHNNLTSSSFLRISPDNVAKLPQLAHFLLCAGLITTVPAMMSGNAQLFGLIKKNGGSPWQRKDESQNASTNNRSSTMVPRIKATIIHAWINFFVFALNLGNWYMRGRGGDEVVAVSKGSYASDIPGAPSNVNVLVSALCLPILLVGSKMGGELVFNHGIGLTLGSGISKKVQ